VLEFLSLYIRKKLEPFRRQSIFFFRPNLSAEAVQLFSVKFLGALDLTQVLPNYLHLIFTSFVRLNLSAMVQYFYLTTN